MILPQVGLGTWQITDAASLRKILAEAYHVGYHLIDTAAAYGNEIAIGKVIKEGVIPRDELILSDKAWNTQRGYLEVQEACKKSLRKLKTDYLDIYLIHWPASPKLHENWREINYETWRGLEKLYQDGYVRSIGVCNFNIQHLEALMENANILPMINQIECHPGWYSETLIDYCRRFDILVEASSPLGSGQILENDTLCKIAKSHSKTTAQISLRWLIQKNILIIPKSSRRERLEENMDIFDFSLSLSEIKQIDEIPYCGGLGLDADEVTEFE